MKKHLSVLLSIAMLCTMCVFGSVTAFAETTGTGTKLDPYLIFTADDLSNLDLPTDALDGEATYIRLESEIVLADSISFCNGVNVDLDLNNFVLSSYGFTLTNSKLNIHNGIVGSDNPSQIGVEGMNVQASVFTADGVTFFGGNGSGNGMGGVGMFIGDNSTFFIKNCSLQGGDAGENANCGGGLNVMDSTGTIINATCVLGAGGLGSETAIYMTGSTVVDGDGNPIYNSGSGVTPVVIPKASYDLPITEDGGSKTHNVTGTYQAGATADTVYSVDIAWGSMEFTYTDISEGTWNPATHTYDGATAAAWSCETDANKITVTNHSNAAIDAGLSYTESITGISCGFYDAATAGNAIEGNTLALTSAAPIGEATTGTEQIGTAYIQITAGSLTSAQTDVTIGTVTVTISDAE